MDSLWVKVVAVAFAIGISGCGGGGGSNKVDTGSVAQVNKAPTAKIEADKLEITAFDAITINGDKSSDPDGDELTYQWKFFDENGVQIAFRIKTENGKAVYDDKVITRRSFHFYPEMWGNYTVELTVSDGKLSDTTKQTIKINPHTRDYPEASIAGVITGKVGSVLWFSGEQSTGAIGQRINYSWQLTDKPDNSQAQTKNDNQPRAFFIPDVSGTYELTLTVTHVDNNLDNSTSIIIKVDDLTQNTAPVAVVKFDERNFTLGEAITLDGSKSYDADGDVLTYQWRWGDKPSSSSATLSTNSKVAQFTADVIGRYDVKLLVSDGDSSSEKVAQINVVNVNVAPVANAGTDITMNVNDTTILDGKASTDPEKQPLRYKWSLASRPENSGYNTLDNPSLNTRSDFTFQPDVVGEYVFNLKVYDGQLYSNADAVTVTVVQNTIPVAVLPEDLVVYSDDTVVIDGSKSYDSDNQSLTYTWSIKSKPTYFFGRLTTQGSKASFTPTENGSYIIQLIVNDGEQDSIEETMLIVRETPVFTRVISGRFVDQLGNPIANVSVSGLRGNEVETNANGEFSLTLQSERENDGVFNSIDLMYTFRTEVNLNLMNYDEGDVDLGDFVLPVHQWKEITLTSCDGYSGSSQVGLTFRTITLDTPQLLFLTEINKQASVDGAKLNVLLPATALTGVYNTELKYTISTDDGKGTFTHEFQHDDTQLDVINLTVCEP